ncbi:hypothetical protein [Ruegeria arenilitoris]|uniref:hypothetical protein n=1 Tax=Ruegeria arenilitoris TaxID=1173585 RepID=UPI00147B9623|nr:hypothetical protein [Ruegeria arenilitoris]
MQKSPHLKVVISMDLIVKLPDRDVGDDELRSPKHQKKFLRNTRSICVHTCGTPFTSKQMYYVKFIVGGVCVHEGIYCIDRLGSQKGYVIVGDDRILDACDSQPVQLAIQEADADSITEWLKSNVDPERRALGTILSEDLKKSEKLHHELSDLAIEARKNFESAHLEREKLKASRRWVWGMSAAAFVGGSLLDLGLLEDKFNFTIDPLALFASAVCVLIVLVLSWLKLRTKQ